MKKRKVGRPRLATAKRERLTIRVTEQVKASLQSRAAELGISTQALANQLFNRALRDLGYGHDE